MKYKEWLENWLANYVMLNYKSRTYDRYTNIVAQHTYFLYSDRKCHKIMV